MNTACKTCNTPKRGLLTVTILLQITAWAHSLYAEITPVASPFTGNALETWEEFPVGNTSSPLAIFGGQATISSDNPFVWMTEFSLGTPGGIGLGPFDARAFDGTHGYATSISAGAGRIDFNSPVTDLGGYWGYAVEYPAANFTFYDFQGSPIGSEVFTFSSPGNNGTLQWQGWHSSVPFYSISYSGYWVVNDSLRITFVPEPDVNALCICAAGLTSLTQRRKRHGNCA